MKEFTYKPENATFEEDEDGKQIIKFIMESPKAKLYLSHNFRMLLEDY